MIIRMFPFILPSYMSHEVCYYNTLFVYVCMTPKTVVVIVCIRYISFVFEYKLYWCHKLNF